MSETVYGIDLGTTYSALAKINEVGAPEIIPNFEGDQTTPSAVYFEGPETAIVGTEAKNIAPTEPDLSSLLIKRKMGTDYRVDFHGTEYTPEAISAIILKELVNAANKQSDADVTKVVITVPAYFGAQEKQATSQAGEIAGLEVVGIVTEPVAAALSIGAKSDHAETIMVYDLGGGTFDTTIMSIGDGSVEVIAVDGNRVLGGADWDAALVDLMVEKFVARAGEDAEDAPMDEEFMLDVQLEAENFKKALTKKESHQTRIAFNGVKAAVQVTREEFEQATKPLLDQTIEISRRTLETAKGKNPDLTIDRVLLVGGSSRMPMVKAALKEELGWNAQDTEFDLAVAKGAAIYGQAHVDKVLSTSEDDEVEVPQDAAPKAFFPGESATLSVTNVLARSVGVALVRDENDEVGYIHFLAHKDDRIPLEAEPLDTGTIVDNQKNLTIRLYEQAGERESEVVEDNRFLKDSTMKLPEGLQKGSSVMVVANITAEGLIQLTATEATTEVSVFLEAAVSILTEEQVDEETSKVAALTLRS